LNIRLLTLVALVSAAPFTLCLAQQPRSGSATTSDGVFDLSQATRGKSGYQNNCSGCHMPQLTGGERAPALAGDVFLQRWTGKTVADLFERIQSTMPQQNPRSLPDQACIEILAFILQANGLPAGDHALEPDRETLRRISIAGLEL
jgi:cytochrome c553